MGRPPPAQEYNVRAEFPDGITEDERQAVLGRVAALYGWKDCRIIRVMVREYNLCAGCGVKYPPFFMLKDALWRQISPDVRAVLCFACAERRLGRPLTMEDLRPCPITEEIRIGYLLAMRDVAKMMGGVP